MTSGKQHLERRLGNKGATNRRHLETIGRPILGDKSEFWKAIGRQLGSHLSETSGRQLELEKAEAPDTTGHYQPDWETYALPQGDRHELETASRTPSARLGDR